ncbi:MAG: type II toxin-antitoxin system HicA family toxin [Anaerolineaceae bacterium]|nr:type II toxin-antitoxin system HicA family toxin [Anaerolineaceae bacterium]
MSRKAKLISRLQQRPKDFTWDELTSLLKHLSYREVKKGKTGGSRRRFVHPSAAIITLHKPHPQNILKRYAIDQVLNILSQEDML